MSQLHSNLTNESTRSSKTCDSSLYQLSSSTPAIYNNSRENHNLPKVTTKPLINYDSSFICSTVPQSFSQIYLTYSAPSKNNPTPN